MHVSTLVNVELYLKYIEKHLQYLVSVLNSDIITAGIMVTDENVNMICLHNIHINLII